MNFGALHIAMSALASGFMAPIGKLAVSRMSSPLFLFLMCAMAAGIGLLFRAGTKSRLRHGLQGPLLKPLLWHTAVIFGALWTLWEGMTFINPAVSAFLSNTQVLFTIILARLLIGERLRAGVPVATVIILVGLVVMKLDAGQAMKTGVDLYGSLLVVASAFLFGLGDVIVKRHVNDMPIMSFLTLRNLLLTGMFGIWVLLRGEAIELDATSYGLILLSAILGPIVARLTFNTGMRSLDVGVCILIFQLYPFFTVGFTYAILEQVPTMLEWVGGMIIISGIFWLQWPAVRQRWLA